MSKIYFYVMTPEDEEPLIVEISKDPDLPGGYSLVAVDEFGVKPGSFMAYYDESGTYEHFIVDENETKETIRETAREKLGTDSLYIRTSPFIGGKKIAIAFKKRELNDIFKEYAFGKITTLNAFLWSILSRRGETEGLVGIVSEILTFVRNVKKEDPEKYLFRPETVMRDASPTIWRQIIKSEKLGDKPKFFITDKNLESFLDASPEEIKTSGVNLVDYAELSSYAEKEVNAVVMDTVSDYYKTKIYRTVIMALSLVLFLLTLFFAYEWTVNESSNYYYDSKIEKLVAEKRALSKKRNRLADSIVYDLYKPFRFDRRYTELSWIGKYDGVEKTEMRDDGRKMWVKVVIKGIDETERFENEASSRGWRTEKTKGSGLNEKFTVILTRSERGGRKK